MPAVLLEMGFLSNAQDEKALGGDRSGSVIEALMTLITDVRRGGPEADHGGSGR
jgi:hypothetical protein